MNSEPSICELYCKLALGSIVTELRDELGKQSRTFVANASKKRLGEKMFKHLELENCGTCEDDEINSMCTRIYEMGGPKVSCEKEENGMKISIHECHLIEAAQIESYICEITQGWIESMISKVYDDSYIVERERTIAEGNQTCVFRCKKNFQATYNSNTAMKKIEELETEITEKVVMIFEFKETNEFNQFSLNISKKQNAEIQNVNMNEGKYLVEVVIYREGMTRIQ